jgi:hypothetical protein
VIKKGKGYADYNIDDIGFEKYDGVVGLTEYCDVIVMAYAGKGYSFEKWVHGDVAITSPEVPFNNVTESVYLELYFSEESDFPWWIVALILLILAALLIWFLIFYRRYYDVFIPESSGIVGKEKVHRKSSYAFTVTDGYSGAISYRVGEDGEWKRIFPDDEGTYTIPKEDVIDHIYLEKRS